MGQRRMPSGIPGLDEILMGGLISRQTYLLVGGPGAGKTIFSVQWILDGVKQGEKGLFITLVEPPDMIRESMSGFGWDMEELDIVDLSETGTVKGNEHGEYRVFPPSEVEDVHAWRDIHRVVEERRPQRIVIDSITQLRGLSVDEYQFRRHLSGLMKTLRQKNCTTFFLFEPVELRHETAIASIVDAIFYLNVETSPERVIDIRSLHVKKFRGSDFMPGLHPMRITPKGIRLFPHRMESFKDVLTGKGMIRSGIPEFDQLLGGGIEAGTVTVVSGQSGTGKSSLAMMFLAHEALEGKRGILYTFEEPIKSILTRSRNLGIAVDSLMGSGLLRIVQVNPLELYPDEFLEIVRSSVEAEGYEIVVIDSLRGYALAMDQFGSITAHLQNMVIYLRSQGVSVLMINEVENITGDLKMTEMGISFLADNIILLRYIERRGKVTRAIGCLKKRLGAFSTELRELVIGARGLEVGEVLEELQGVLTGVPQTTNKDFSSRDSRHMQ